jgi:hypothetical protein
VLIVRVARDAAVVARIRAELEANDWNVREIGPDPASARGSLSALATSSRARAVLRMQPERGAIELWVSGEGDAAGSGEVLVVPRGERDDALLALRATEALRARGLRLQRRSEPDGGSAPGGTGQPGRGALPSGSPVGTVPAGGEPRSPTAAPTAATAPAQNRAEPRLPQPLAAAETGATQRPKPSSEPRPERAAQSSEPAPEALAAESGDDDAPVEEPDAPEADADSEIDAEIEPEEPHRSVRPKLLSIELAPGVSVSPGGVLPAWMGGLNVRVQPGDRWSLNVIALAPFAGAILESNGQRAWIRSYLAGGSLDVHWPGRIVELTAGAGAAFMLTWMKGLDTAGTNIERDDFVPTGALLARAGVHLPLTPWVKLGARVLLGMSIPKLTVEFSEMKAGYAGQPFFVATVGADFSLF